MNIIKTNCDGCVFIKAEDEVQVGCTLDRDSKLGVEEVDDETNSFLLERFCNTYRPDEWFSDLDFDQSLNPEETVMKEIMPRIGFFVRLDTENGDEAIEQLKITIDSIAEIENGPPAYVAVITDKVEFNEEIWGIFLEKFEHPKTKYHIVQLKVSPKDVITTIDAAFPHAQNGWVYTTTSGEKVPKDVLNRLHDLINVQIKQVMMVEPYDRFNGLMFPAFVFKFLNGNKTKIFQDDNSDSREFIEKMKAAEKRGKTKTILTWEEFNAS
tara:strand:+ start:3730 stop:4533 length:804 start_codon:yes stop_codon:yes gene_type:complete